MDIAHAVNSRQAQTNNSSLLAFAALIFASVIWAVVLVIFFPRGLGRFLSFLANRTSRGTFHLRIPILNIYPLAGRAVAHAVRYTTPDLCVSVEELVFQCRWWRRQINIREDQLLTVDPPDVLNPVALAQEQVGRENSAAFVKRVCYRVRRWWRRTAVTKEDATNSSEPPPLISLILVGLRVRGVNNQRNYAHVRQVLAFARASVQSPSLSPTDENFDVHIDDIIMESPDDLTPAEDPSSASSFGSSNMSQSSYASSVDEKPFGQRILELASLRITDGAFYICDMGQSPLALLTIDSAKIRYRYGAPACDADECRKRIRVGISTLKVSVASHDAIRRILDTSESYIYPDGELPPAAPVYMQDNTNRMIKKVVSEGHLGISNPFWDEEIDGPRSQDAHRTIRSKRSNFISRLQSFPPRSRNQLRTARKTHTLCCVDLLHSTSAVVEYVFDEPGPSPDADQKMPSSSSDGESNTLAYNQEEASSLPPPACRVSVLLHGADFKYDVGSIADFERVIERLQPMLYDLLPLARRMQTSFGKRNPTGMQIEIEARPKGNLSRMPAADTPPLIHIPFSPRYVTWMGLCCTKVREWAKVQTGPSLASSENLLPPSHLDIQCSLISVRTEIPFRSGVQQKTVFQMKNVNVKSAGVVDIPLLKSQKLTVTRIIHYPELWNEEHAVSTEMVVSSSEVFYVPDLIRIISDISATFQAKSRKPLGANYFVPFNETTKIVAEDQYCVFLSCSRDNAWKDVLNGVADEFGRMKLCGETGELRFTPLAATEYQSSTSSLAWSLSLPNVVGKLSVLMPILRLNENIPEAADQRMESSRMGYYKARTPSIARRGRNHPEVMNLRGQSMSSVKQGPLESVDINLFHFKGACQLKSKVVSYEDRRYLETNMPAFLDSVNTNDISLAAQNLVFDLNPHHTTRLMNVIRNYSGPGTHTISLMERASLEEQRHSVATDILLTNRYPTIQECFILNLSQSYTLPSALPRPGVDDVLHLSFKIDSVLARLHDLPHSACSFDLKSQDTCSVFFDNLDGQMSSNRLGMDLTLTPGPRRNVISIQGGCNPSMEESATFVYGSSATRMMPTAIIEDLELRMRGLSSKNWGTFFSNMTISIGKVSGCLLDATFACLLKFAATCFPKSLSDDITSVGALLSVDNIEICVNKFDMLILSCSSKASAERSAEINTLFSQRNDSGDQQQEEENFFIPKFLAGVTQLRLRHGIRMVSSTLSNESKGILTRVVVPAVALDVLVPSGGMLTPWVDHATLRAQVAHATLPTKRCTPQSLFADLGVLRRAAEFREAVIDMTYSSKPLLWQKSVSLKQRKHILLQNEITRNEQLSWYELPSGGQEESNPIEPGGETDFHSTWWDFLTRCKTAPIVKKYRRNRTFMGRTDILSVRIVSDITILVSPEFLELICEIVIRDKEQASEREMTVSKEDSENVVRIKPEVLTSDILNLWREFEKARIPSWVSKEPTSPSSSFITLETKAVTFFLLSPCLPTDSREGDVLIFSKAMDSDIFVSIPSGICLLTDLTLDVRQPDGLGRRQPGRPKKNVVRTNVLHFSTPAIFIGCNKAHLIQIGAVLFIKHDRNALFHSAEQGSDYEKLKRRDRTTLVGKIGQFLVGRPSSSLNNYASFSRIASIFILLWRVVRLESSSLARKRIHRMTVLCRRLLSISPEEILLKEPEMTHSFFVNALRPIRLSPGEGAWTDHLSLSEHSFPCASNIPSRDDIPMQSAVHSVDITLRNMLFLVMNQEIAHSNVFICKGGKTSTSKSTSSVLDGYVFNASFGTVSLSLRDDIAADTLRMVSNVASFVQRVTKAIPMLRNEKYPFYRADEERESPVGYGFHNVKGDNFPLSTSGRASISKSMSVGYSATSNLRQIARSKNTSTLSGTEMNPIQDIGRHQTASFCISPDKELMENIGLDRNVFPLGTTSSLEFDHVHQSNSNSDLGSTAVSTGTSDQPAVDHASSFVLGQSHIQRNESHSLSLHSLGKDDEEAEFTNVSIRTAGDSGPPNKRSKCMVPITPVMPPAFSNRAVIDLEQAHSFPFTGSKPTLVPIFSDRRMPVKESARPSATEIKASEPKKLPSFASKASATTKSSAFVSRATEPMKTSIFVSNGSFNDEEELKSGLRRLNMTLFVSCGEFVSRYYRGRDVPAKPRNNGSDTANISFLVRGPRLTFMSQPDQQSHSIVVTASSAKLFSSNNPNCTMTGSIAQIGLTVSLAQGRHPSALPKLISSCRVTEFKATLQAKDLQSVLRFRREFKMDVKGLLSAFLTAKHSISEMAQATRLSSSHAVHPSRTAFSTMAFDILFESFEIRLGGFHPKDCNMTVSYVLDGIFFSVVASEDDNAALTLGLRLYGHGLQLSSPSWPNNEFFGFPSLDLHGVQWGQTTGLPTIFKVTAEPLMSSTSFQGLRHVIFTLAGLLAFQNTAGTSDTFASSVNFPQMELPGGHAGVDGSSNEHKNEPPPSGATPFTRSYAAWERTNGVRIEISIRPTSLSLASGQVVALFDVETITGIFEWNKLVVSGVQLRTAINVPKVSLSFMRMPTSDFSAIDVRPDERRTSLSVVLERAQIDLLKTQADLAHTFIFRSDVQMISGQVRPWRLLLDAAVWADEQEFVSDLQSINYSSLSASRQRSVRAEMVVDDPPAPTEHRLILFGANIHRVMLAVPLLNSEQYGTSRLAIRATELHVLARHRFDNLSAPKRNTFEVKSHFLGILWEGSSLLSSHHTQITVGTKSPSPGSLSHFGSLNIVMYPGTWRICPRRDFVMAILDAKNRKDNKTSSRSHDHLEGPSNTPSCNDCSFAGDSVSNATEKEGRLLVETLSLKILRTSGFIEGLEGESAFQKSTSGNESTPGKKDTSEKVVIPAFSISAVRNTSKEFDLIDVDFSGREGEFPNGCLQRVANLFSDLFGAVQSDQQRAIHEGAVPQPQEASREISRNVSVLIRFGRSLYRAQEEANLSIESKIGLFAGKSSALLVSVSTDGIISESCSHTTVITGVSPKLALEITPVLDGAQVQSLRLVNARFLHGICPCHAPHTVLHISRLTALMEAKTLLLTENRLRQRENVAENILSDASRESQLDLTANKTERNLMFILGMPTSKHKSLDDRPEPTFKDSDVRLQLKMTKKASASDDNLTTLILDRLHIGVNRVRMEDNRALIRQNVYGAVHELLIRGTWDILSFRLKVRENLACFDVKDGIMGNGVPGSSSVVTNIMNRLLIENLQYGKHTLKLNVDALAALWTAPVRNVIIESTRIHSEVSHTLRKALAKLIGQWKKLRNEVKLHTERDANRKGKVSSAGIKRSSRAEDDAVVDVHSTLSARTERPTEAADGAEVTSLGSESSGISAALLQRQRLMGLDERTKVSIKGDEFVIMMRGYQFDETRHSAMISLEEYGVHHVYDFDNEGIGEVRQLETDFKEMIISYNDDERMNCSELFKIPKPALRLSIREERDGLHVELLGDLEVRLGHGFYNWQEFRELMELTVRGIAPAPPRDGAEVEGPALIDTEPSGVADLWDGRQARTIDVRLNPRIDVIGDLTADVLPMMSARLKKQVDGIPKQMYDYIVIPLESLSKAMCDPLFR